ncbi:MAG: type II toxin-antitoxin system VapC family toxin [Pseudonocardia sp.]|nr:type II toxin-antitoxin system VapC family toxin [Pseudonocardia sp.]
MIVLDANVIIAYLDGDHVHHRRAEQLLAREVDDDFGANSLTLAEVLVIPAREQCLDVVRTVLQDLEIQELPFPGDTALQLAQLRADTGLTMPDCCVLLAAEHATARVASFDEQLTRAATARHLETVTD